MRDRLFGLGRAAREWMAGHPRALRAGMITVAAVLAVAGVTSLVYLNHLRSTLPDRNTIERLGEMDQATTIFDAQDRPAFTIFREQRIDVPLSKISPDLLRALVAIEDQRFYVHHGFDVVRIVAAAVANLRRGRAAQGGSTITQQLARQSFLKPDKTLRRKLQEVILAWRIEQLYTKTKILELYLNKVYFGDGLYGAEAASRGFFGKPASDLTVAEAALLAGLVKSPSTYAPTVSLERATQRRNVVLQAMLETGAIDRAAWQKARGAHVTLANTLESRDAHGQYFKEQVRRELVERFGWQRVYQGGLRVYSTIDMGMQDSAESAVRESLTALDARRRKAVRSWAGDPPLQAALIAMDPHSGQIRAMVGGRDFAESPFNRAVQAKRQPGSAFKPFLYAAALEAGYTPATVIDHLNDPIETLEGAWTPEDEHSTADAMSLRAALRISSNRAAVQLLQRVGIPKTVEYAKNLGIGNVPSVPSLALGVGEVTLQSMTAAYAAFANHGLVPAVTSIRRVEDRDGQVLYQEEDPEPGRRAIGEPTAFLMSTMLADVVNAGTAARARQLGFTLPAAGKTGTTNDFNDAWFVGFTTKVVAGVWIGFDQPQTILPNGFAADVAVPVWARFMKAATKGDRPAWFDVPPGITSATVCRLSGKLATYGCEQAGFTDESAGQHEPMVYTEYFATGTAPTSACDLHALRGQPGKFAGLLNTPPEVSHPPPSQPDAPTATEPEPAPKRGFWGRLFGFGKRQPK
jgi:penicillin-binding protein 1A